MDKFAQRRGILNRIKDKTNIKGIAAEKYFQPELLRIMTSLRKCDNDIRSIALGKRIENGEVGSDNESLKNLLKMSKTNFARREYMIGVSLLSRFHKKMFEIEALCRLFDKDLNKIHHQFLFKELKDDHLSELQHLDKRWAEEMHKLVKIAGIFDTIHNMTSARGRALALWEQRYEKDIGKLRDNSVDMLDKSDYVYSILLNSLDQMDAFRAARDVSSYEETILKLSSEIKKYDEAFKTYYKNIVKPFIDKANLFAQKEAIENAPETKAPDAVRPVTPTLMQGTAPSTPMVDSAPKPAVQEVPLSQIKSDDFEDVKSAQMIHVLESMSEESPLILASYIKKCAKALEESNPEQSIKLLNIVKRIKG